MHSTELNQSLTGEQDWVADGMGGGEGWMIKSMVEDGTGMEAKRVRARDAGLGSSSARVRYSSGSIWK